MLNLLNKKADFELTEIAGVQCLAQWEKNEECLRLIAVFNDGGVIRSFDSLIPHGLAILEWDRNMPPQKHIEAAKAVLETWIIQRLHEDNSNLTFLNYFPEFRGYSNWPRNPLPIEGLDLLEEYCKTVKVDDILEGSGPKWFTSQQSKKFAEIAEEWVRSNQEYLNRKAEYFADYWASQIGFLGSSGDCIADGFHAMLAAGIPEAQAKDIEKFRQSVKSWAVSQFNEGRIPFLDVDYTPGRELRRLLAESDLSHLSPLFPWKTWMHLEFNDRPPLKINQGDTNA